MESRTPAPTLRSIGFQTKKLFKDAIINASALNAEDVASDDPFETQLAAEANRFGLWAMNLGVFAPDHGSLDYRVRDAETIRGMLETFLISLNTSLNRVLAYCSSSSNDLVRKNGGDESLEEDLSGSESSEDGWNEFDESTSSNLTLLLDGVRGPLDRLYKLSTWIRNPSSRSISSKVRSHKHIDPETEIDFLKEVESFEIDYIRSVFFQYRISKIRADGQSHEGIDEGKLTPDTPTASEEIHLDDSELSLINRLARANVRRRQRFSYWRKHQEKLALYADFDGPQDPEVQIGNNIEAAATSQNFGLKQNDKIAGLVAVPPDFGSVTTATRLNIPQLAVFKDDFSAVSVSKYTPSNWLPDNETLEFPEPPSSESSDKEFECPYCFTICRKALLKSDAWKAHLIHDLQPYICTYKDCTSGDNLYDDRGEWIQHESLIHRRVFHCAMHRSEIFLSRKDFEDHIQDGHLNPDNENPVALILQASQSTSIVPDRCCPICLLSVEKLDALTKHIALHLERFSLFSLPRDIYIDSAEENEKASELSKKANPNPRGSRDGDFEEDQWDIKLDGKIKMTSSSRAPAVLVTALSHQRAKAKLYGHGGILKHISDGLTRHPQKTSMYSRPKPSTDVLYAPDYKHNADNYTCERCDPTRIIPRLQRGSGGASIEIHYGSIASSNRMVNNGVERNSICAKLGDILCLDIGLAGLMDVIPFLAIRGICNYSDSHRNDIWEPYASITAASVAKDILMIVPEGDIRKTSR
ncbi:hypothetical protein TWF103_007911 [Orbilia oligospora]|nr:hypothetical protein TWF103_007911 [Orbilia oligospora]